MRRNVLTPPDGLDLDIRELAEAAARRAGMTLDQWIDALQDDHPAAEPPRPTPEERLDAIIARMRRTKAPQAKAFGAAFTPAAPPSRASRAEPTDERLEPWSRHSADRQDRLATALTDALASLTERLDGIERRVEAERVAPPMPRIVFPMQEAAEALAPLSETLAGLRGDMVRLTDRLEQPLQVGAPPVWDAIRNEIGHLQGTVGTLATQDDITALAGLVRHLAANLASDHGARDIGVLATAVSELQLGLDQALAAHADAVYQKVSGQIEGLKDRVSRAAETGVDRSVIDFLSSQIVDLRQDLAHRAEPGQIAQLSSDVATLGRQLAELRQNQVGRGDFVALKASLEDICAVLTRTVEHQARSDVPERLQDLSEKIDHLAHRPEPALPSLEPMAKQLALLTERMGALNEGRQAEAQTLAAMMERLSGEVRSVVEKPDPSPELLLQRFERIEEELRQVGQQADTSTVELLLRALGEKLEQHPVPDLEAIESRIAALSAKLSETSEDNGPTAADVSAAHLRELQDEASRIAETAARAALREAQARASADDGLDALKQGFVELKALHLRSDKKTQHALQAVHDALETLIGRSAGDPVAPPAAPAGTDVPVADDLPVDRLETAIRKLHAVAISQAEAISAPEPDQIGHHSLAGPVERQAPSPAPQPEAPRNLTAAAFASQPGDTGGLRASFIAAARRATQTIVAAQDSSPEKPGQAESQVSTTLAETSDAAPEPQGNLIERLKKTLEGHKRPLVLGLAALVLAGGTAQVILNASNAGPVGGTAQPLQAALAGPALTLPPEDSSPLFQPAGLAAMPVQDAPKFWLDPASIGELPQGLPEALKKAALRGDASAVYEIASRAADGREMDKDPALAARLMERAARAGLAPAQERLAMFYEKGFGLTRDAKLAVTWYERAATGGNTRAMHNLATLLAAGVGGKPDYAAALRWYLEAAEAGVRDSQFNIGVLFARAVGTRPDLTQSYKWFALAAAQGDPEAAKKRDEVAAKLSPSDLASIRSVVERWRPRAVDISANAVALPSETATLPMDTGRRI